MRRYLDADEIICTPAAYDEVISCLIHIVSDASVPCVSFWSREMCWHVVEVDILDVRFRRPQAVLWIP